MGYEITLKSCLFFVSKGGSRLQAIVKLANRVSTVPVFSFLLISGCPSALWPLRFSVCLLHNPCENRESDISLYLGCNSFIPVIQVVFLRIFSFGVDVSFFFNQLGFFFFLVVIYLFWLHWVFVVALCAFSIAMNGGYSLVTMCRLLIAVAFLVLEHGL